MGSSNTTSSTRSRSFILTVKRCARSSSRATSSVRSRRAHCGLLLLELWRHQPVLGGELVGVVERSQRRWSQEVTLLEYTVRSPTVLKARLATMTGTRDA